jgi:hypothetical protein
MQDLKLNNKKAFTKAYEKLTQLHAEGTKALTQESTKTTRSSMSSFRPSGTNPRYTGGSSRSAPRPSVRIRIRRPLPRSRSSVSPPPPAMSSSPKSAGGWRNTTRMPELTGNSSKTPPKLLLRSSFVSKRTSPLWVPAGTSPSSSCYISTKSASSLDSSTRQWYPKRLSRGQRLTSSSDRRSTPETKTEERTPTSSSP